MSKSNNAEFAPVSVPQDFYDYVVSFMRAMGALYSDAIEFKGAYEEYVQKYPPNSDEDWDDEI
jgi:hypothetical protein